MGTASLNTAHEKALGWEKLQQTPPALPPPCAETHNTGQHAGTRWGAGGPTGNDQTEGGMSCHLLPARPPLFSQDNGALLGVRLSTNPITSPGSPAPATFQACGAAQSWPGPADGADLEVSLNA